MNPTDLKDLLEARSQRPAELTTFSRIDGVRRRVRARRRRQLATGAALTLVGLVAVGGVGMAASRVHPPSPTHQLAAPSSTTEGFADYEDGYQLIGASSVALPATTATISFVGHSAEVDVTFRCSTGDVTVWVRVALDKNPGAPTPCGTNDSRRVTVATRVDAGVRSTATLTVLHAERDGKRVPTPASGRVAFAVSAAVPYERYPKPPRPTRLTPIEGMRAPDPRITARAVAGQWQRPVAVAAVWPIPRHLTAVSQTPGRLVLSVNGTTIATVTSWDYRAREWAKDLLGPAGKWRTGSSLDIRNGERVEVLITPQDVTGDWALAFSDSPAI
ncbi:hypothetical protein [Pilimelia columellifera]|uniref:Uncharacterized protein n=1 Tax=Pilimelia columellifera subsp. columellifera TaxID=706583 RepID=A0ABP6AYE6_9ACTN